MSFPDLRFSLAAGLDLLVPPSANSLVLPALQTLQYLAPQLLTLISGQWSLMFLSGCVHWHSHPCTLCTFCRLSRCWQQRCVGLCSPWSCSSCCACLYAWTPHTGKELEMELSEKPEQTALIRCREWPDKYAGQQPA